MTRNLEARLDGSTPGESRLSKSAHPREAETPRILEAVLGTAPRTPLGPYPCGPQASPEIESCDIADILFARFGISRRTCEAPEQLNPTDDATSRRKLILRTSGASVLNS